MQKVPPQDSPQGGLTVFGLKDLIQQAQGLQSKIAALQEELAEKVVTGSSGGDMVKVEANGASEILSITIEKELLDPADPEMLQDLIVAAVNDALEEISRTHGPGNVKAHRRTPNTRFDAMNNPPPSERSS